MANFMTLQTETEFRKYVQGTLAEKYMQTITVTDHLHVTGINGSDEIIEALKIQFIPSEANTEWVEDKIASDIHRYAYEHDLKINRHPVIEREVHNGKIRYGLIYTYMGDPINCKDCKYKCKKLNVNELHYCEYYEEGEDL